MNAGILAPGYAPPVMPRGLLGDPQPVPMPYGRAGRWTPLDLGSSLAVWFDADDRSSIALNGSAVSQWYDKSGNGRHVSQAAASQQPAYGANTLNGRPVIRFDGVNDTLQRATARLNGLSFVSIFAVLRYITATNEDMVVGIGSAGSTASIRAMYRGATSSSTTQGFSGWNRDVFSSAYSVDVAGGFHIFAVWNVALASPNNVFISRDGLSDAYSSAGTFGGGTANTLAATADGLGIGELVGSTTRYTNADYAEVVILSTAISQNDRLLLEGYLAWKWGLQNNLPASHLFRSVAP